MKFLAPFLVVFALFAGIANSASHPPTLPSEIGRCWFLNSKGENNIVLAPIHFIQPVSATRTVDLIYDVVTVNCNFYEPTVEYSAIFCIQRSTDGGKRFYNLNCDTSQTTPSQSVPASLIVKHICRYRKPNAYAYRGKIVIWMYAPDGTPNYRITRSPSVIYRCD